MSLNERPAGVWRTVAATLFTSALATACQQAAPPAEPAVHRLLYYWGGEVNVACPCGTDLCWWVTGPATLRTELRGFVEANTSAPYTPVYLEATGTPGPRLLEGFPAEYDGTFELSAVRTIASSLPPDCTPR